MQPVNDAQRPVIVFDERGQTLYPITVVAVEDAFDIANFRSVYMTANNSIQFAASRCSRHRLFKCSDIADRVLYSVLEVLR